ncbi:SagB family peptide dehydrogenase [Streptomyces sp. NBC_00249]|uniref:SagB family peptide dehydrogenase n=1 Tax=Streptomyces sp. NBC_00249 TaxID=2975690 RepID=UPI00224CB82C|nr:SagB family peptide dehydrogenase [Streptomyces sp. NBC_00249]MCX5192574.1 SagB family peptide dehydrogenase [Streptomyces sp. NBC_00249]
MGYAHDYASAILHRGRVPMEPVDFVPDWADRPRKAKYYPYAETLPLPAPPDGTPPGPGPAGGFTLPLLSGMLQDSYGLTGRRLGVQANTDLAALPHYPQANWSRGTASGGGLYPVGVYWAAGAGGPLTPGVYHYAPHQHGLRRLLTGDVTGEVREALDAGPGRPEGPRAAGQYLLLSVKYWQNAFKYNSFSFHAVSMDVGTVLQTWRLWAAAHGLRIAPALWFDEERLAGLLGVLPEEEGIFAVVPLEWEGEDREAPAGPPPARVSVRHRDAERSRTVLPFETLRRIHGATLGRAADRPAPGALDTAAAYPPRGGQPVPLPAAAPAPMGPAAALRARRSSFGRFDASRPLGAAQLAAALADCAATSAGSEAERAGGPPLTALYAFVNHVEGIAPGSYAYDPRAHALRLVVPGPPGPFLQRNYFLSNYNLEQAGAVLVPTVRTGAVLDAVGDRGYRLVGAAVGAVAQTFYTTAAAHGLGAGVALGFDNVSYAERLGFEDTDEAPLLVMLLGHERPRPADFRHEIA